MANRPLIGVLGLVVAGLALTGCTPCQKCTTRDKWEGKGPFDKGTPSGGVTPAVGVKTPETRIDPVSKFEPMGGDKSLPPVVGGDKGLPPIGGGGFPPLPTGVVPDHGKLPPPGVDALKGPPIKNDGAAFPVQGVSQPPVSETPMNDRLSPPPFRSRATAPSMPVDTTGGTLGTPKPQPTVPGVLTTPPAPTKPADLPPLPALPAMPMGGAPLPPL